MSNQQQQPKAIDADALTSAITKAVESCSIETIQSLPPIQRAIQLATGMQMMRAALTDEVVQRVFMPLQGSKLGFRTDKDTQGGYPLQVVRDVATEAMIRGFQLVGNEVNIIAGNFYATKEGFERKVAEFPGLTQLELDVGVPHVKEGGALVPYYATWLLNGVPGGLVCDQVKVGEQVVDRRIPIRVNERMGIDAILGKAKRKFCARVYERLSGQRVPETDEDLDAIPTDGTVVDERTSANRAKTDDLINKHKANAGAPPAAKPETTTPAKPAREMGEEG